MATVPLPCKSLPINLPAQRLPHSYRSQHAIRPERLPRDVDGDNGNTGLIGFNYRCLTPFESTGEIIMASTFLVIKSQHQKVVCLNPDWQ